MEDDEWSMWHAWGRGEQHTERVSMRKPDGKRQFRTPRRRRKAKIKADLKETEWDGVDWTDLTQDMGQWPQTCEHGNEPSGSRKCEESDQRV